MYTQCVHSHFVKMDRTTNLESTKLERTKLENEFRMDNIRIQQN